MPENILLDRPDLAVSRVRYPLKFRLLQVKRVLQVTPHMVRVTLTGNDLDGFQSGSFDDHMKVFFPPPGADKPTLPQAGPNGPIFSETEPRPIARDFTPRRYDPAAGELDIEFALHAAGPATIWAAQARVGQYLGIGGPRGSMIIPAEFDWHLLIGDETALPAIARRIEELPDNMRVAALIEVAQPSAHIAFDSKPNVYIEWRFRNAADPRADLLSALREMHIPEGEGYVWAAGESTLIRAVRQHLCIERGIDKSRIRAASYWKRGADAVHEVFED
ncbi:siderophore-interacting protein [Glaciimonas sp. PCH181]|uniref:siderophore-interacting protein n=1 Tax=Glaciimonas sp. PCH181 TaxID=2133943 RepID=UPI000D3AF312|nr:siderophore-interacting protein [Glaciimonas sp. PCH181]PUA18509.1 NADPH-dependent ferric siderophore reductase [Glaciimonas sp. PCH181]